MDAERTATKPSLSQTDAKQSRAERIAYYRKIYSVGIGRSPSRLRKAEVARAAELDALADEVRAAGTDPNGVVRLANAADRQRQKLTWLNGDAKRDEPPNHAALDALRREYQSESA